MLLSLIRLIKLEDKKLDAIHIKNSSRTFIYILKTKKNILYMDIKVTVYRSNIKLGHGFPKSGSIHDISIKLKMKDCDPCSYKQAIN